MLCICQQSVLIIGHRIVCQDGYEKHVEKSEEWLVDNKNNQTSAAVKDFVDKTFLCSR